MATFRIVGFRSPERTLITQIRLVGWISVHPKRLFVQTFASLPHSCNRRHTRQTPGRLAHFNFDGDRFVHNLN